MKTKEQQLEELRCKLSIALGWSNLHFQPTGTGYYEIVGTDPDGIENSVVPAYDSDLTALHQVECKLALEQRLAYTMACLNTLTAHPEEFHLSSYAESSRMDEYFYMLTLSLEWRLRNLVEVLGVGGGSL